MANETPLPKGIMFFDKHQNAPDFVICTAVITLNDLVKFGKDNPDLLTDYNGNKQLRLQVLRSRDGKIYSSVDTYKKDGAAPKKPAPAASRPAVMPQDDNPDDLPF